MRPLPFTSTWSASRHSRHQAAATWPKEGPEIRGILHMHNLPVIPTLSAGRSGRHPRPAAMQVQDKGHCKEAQHRPSIFLPCSNNHISWLANKVTQRFEHHRDPCTVQLGLIVGGCPALQMWTGAHWLPSWQEHMTTMAKCLAPLRAGAAHLASPTAWAPSQSCGRCPRTPAPSQAVQCSPCGWPC